MNADAQLSHWKNQLSSIWMSTPWVWNVLAGVLLIFGVGIRMIDLQTPPLDFHPTRQLRSAIIARGMYYQDLPNADPQKRADALNIWSTMERYEPPILEHLVAFSYRVAGGEYLWIARIYSSLFWVIGAAALYALVRRIFSPPAALFALGFDLFLPWSVIASRAFQPDPAMVMLILISALALYRWSETKASSWLWTVLAGLFCGVAVLVKAMAAYPIGGMALFVFLGLVREEGRLLPALGRVLRRPQLWVLALIALLIPGYYYIGLGQRSTEFASFWIFSFVGLLTDTKFYVHWLGLIRGIVDVMVFFGALLGIFLFPRRGRAIIAGLWLGYLFLGLTFPFQIYTHDYYSLMLVPIVAIGLAGYAHLIAEKIQSQPALVQVLFTVFFLSVAGYYAYVGRSEVLSTHYYQTEPYPWEKMAAELPTDGTIIGLTHDYGNRLKYYGWRMVNRLWPAQGDLDLSAAAGVNKIGDFPSYFKSQTEGMDYFLVTLFGDLEAQPNLKAMLYDHYPIARQGDGYILFDLRHPRP